MRAKEKIAVQAEYDVLSTNYPNFAESTKAFTEGTDTPREFLERGLEIIAAREQSVQAFVHLRLDEARKEADASTHRWKAARALSPVDGMPFAIKDCFDLAGVPTRVNSALFADAPAAAFDAAHVFGLRQGGAIVVGKTVTTELTMAAPGPTRNPWDLERTPGGSSSGSAAAVAANIVPLATGSQVRGSVIRPASICGVFGMKPTYGSLSRLGGFDPSPSLNHLGFLGGHLEDIWNSACQIATVVGGDPGHLPFSTSAFPESARPKTLVRQYTVGWQFTDDATKQAFESYLSGLRSAGVEIIEPSASDELTLYEAETTSLPEFFFNLMLWETRGIFLQKRDEAVFSETMARHIANADRLQLSDYEKALERRDALRKRHNAFAGKVDGFIAPAHIGPGQIGSPALGTPWYNDASSAIGAPSFSLPLLRVDELPVGIQIVGFSGHDAHLTGIARWLCGKSGISR
jgi:Asp-tRNA(Asn)/Glu-tRNA(Gln) amidotransferase A subunit family amidase